tara:strand:- start:915 stop:1226 length:312 start_codon:yes stop_codon:yes gene_type:complete
MDIFSVLEQFGIPVSVALAFGFFIWKQNKYIQNDLTKDLHHKFNELIIDSAQTREIVVKLIDAIKITQLDNKELKACYRELVNIIRKLSGNGLRSKFRDDEDY